MTDITRLLASLKRRSAHAKKFGHDVLFVKIEDLDALGEALEKAQQELEREREKSRRVMSRIAELESRTVTVKLPEVQQPIDGTGYANAAGARYYKECVIKSLTAQGIKWEAE
ncbi:hypothetical protein MLE08_003664 [Klebsiella aerogenes]|nr:hypothetical protein [Klebsiella aerogenes]